MTEPGRSFLLPLGSGPMNPLAAADLPPLGRDGPTGEAADNATIERILLDMAPLKETHDQHEAFRTRLAVCVVEVCGSQCRLETFGSTVSGFATRDSDLDFNLNPDPSEESPLDIITKCGLLKRLGNHFRECGFQCTPVLGARVPVVKMRDPSTGVCADLSMQNDHPVHKSQLLKEYASIDQRVRPLVMLVKGWAKARGINSAPEGTFSSFALTLLVLHLLQTIQPPMLPILTSEDLPLRGDARQRAEAAGQPLFLTRESSLGEEQRVGDVQADYHRNGSGVLTGWGAENEQSVAALFAAFVKYYAEFDFTTRVVPAKSVEPLSKFSTRFQGNQKMVMCLQDPVDPSDNVARNINFRAPQIRFEFARAHRLVCEGKFRHCWDIRGQDGH